MTSRRHSDSGQSTVEFALVLPLFVLLLVALLEIAVLARYQLHADAIARDAARVASTAKTRADVSTIIADVVDASGEGVASSESVIRNGVLTVRVAVVPRTASIFGVARWLGGSRHLVGEASFAMEFAIADG